MDIIFPLIKNHQLKSDMNKKILINAIISLKIANRPQNIPTFIMDYKISYVGSRKSVEARGRIFFFVRRVQNETLGEVLCLPSVQGEALGEVTRLPSVLCWHSATF